MGNLIGILLGGLLGGLLMVVAFLITWKLNGTVFMFLMIQLGLFGLLVVFSGAMIVFDPRITEYLV